jgi:exopolysaccharide biosynthesis polyprenyl glycosylphosphotransferase
MRGFLKTNAAILQMLSHLLDPLVVAGGTYLLYFLFQEKGFGPYVLIRALAIYGPFLILLIFPLFRIYRSWRGETLASEFKVLVGAWCAALIIFNAIILLLATEEELKILWPYGLFELKVFWIWAFVSLLLMACCRALGRFFFRFLRWKGFNIRKAIIVGAGDLGKNAAEYFLRNTWLGIKPIGFFDDRVAKSQVIALTNETQNLPMLGTIAEAIPYSLKKKPDMIIISLPLRAEEKISELVWKLGTNGIAVYLIPDLFAYGLQKAHLQQLGDLPVMSFNLFPLWKRIFDMLFAAIVLVVASPLFLIITFLIKREDNGPIFYGHKRIRETGKTFFCLKFRTMHVDADKRLQKLLAENPDFRLEWEKNFKLKNDPRITRIGKFLRKSSLDEFPQFINVLKGEMSVVGARPIVMEELTNYYKKTAITYCAMKPGITGLWQVGKRSDTEDYRERVELDRWYILNASLSLDLRIIFKTFCKMFIGKGAY